MKLLHILDHTLPIADGYAMRSRKILAALGREGIACTAVTSPRHEHYAPGPVPPVEWIEGVCHYRSGRVVPTSVPGLRELAGMRALRRKILEAAHKVRPDLIHAHSPVLNVLPLLSLGRRLGIPVVYEIRAFWEDAAVDQGTHREWGPRYRIIRTLETWACRRADAVVTICEGLRADLISRGIPSEKITVVPNAVDPDEFQPRKPDPTLRARWGVAPEDFLLGFIGSFYHYEGLDTLLHALARLNPKETSSAWRCSEKGRADEGPRRAVKLLLVGGGEEEERLRGLVESLGIQDRVVFAGRVPPTVVPDVYAVLDALVLPRKSIRLTELVTPLKPLEAMAMGVPVIASDVSGHRELICDRDTGLLFRADNSAALIEAILTLKNNSGLARHLADAGRSWVFSVRTWQRNGEIYRALYEMLAAGSCK